MITTVVIAIVAGMAMPAVASMNLAGNETAVRDDLQLIFQAQRQVRTAAVIDSDRNGGGEYGFFQELSGLRKMRSDSDADRIADADGPAELDPPAILADFATVGGTGLLQRGGYTFRVYLPAADLGWEPEPGPNEDYQNVSAFHAMSHWACYAWPTDHGRTGNRAYFINETGRILSCANETTRYSGTANIPGPDAALLIGGNGKMDAQLALDEVGEDGNTWRVDR